MNTEIDRFTINARVEEHDSATDTGTAELRELADIRQQLQTLQTSLNQSQRHPHAMHEYLSWQLEEQLAAIQLTKRP
ncbi:hypothetical protein [Gynuella sunshinyii]|uniref:Uncharacterized protein n=1 Tax=Gynuella sunshinyii YC6258 TaxID=1445510 RepID=A0A0C5VLQ2_9GAMM|nr:hypothetical protein [Gynuella sunshinyii]AJQ94238.1 hypothetical Protein YC6258_02200 [Gynuella sunshinyii YC6258]